MALRGTVSVCYGFATGVCGGYTRRDISDLPAQVLPVAMQFVFAGWKRPCDLAAPPYLLCRLAAVPLPIHDCAARESFNGILGALCSAGGWLQGGSVVQTGLLETLEHCLRLVQIVDQASVAPQRGARESPRDL